LFYYPVKGQHINFCSTYLMTSAEKGRLVCSSAEGIVDMMMSSQDFLRPNALNRKTLIWGHPKEDIGKERGRLLEMQTTADGGEGVK